MNKLNEMNYTVEQMADTRWFLRFNEKNQKGESLLIELCLLEDDPNWKNSNPKVWYKNGYINRVLKARWSLGTYVDDSEGRCCGMYNPQHKLSEDGHRMVIDFDWMMEATEENKQKLINEVYRLFSSATGKSATEEKIDKIKEYAKKNGLEVVTEVPEGWEKRQCATDPIGSISVCNCKMGDTFKALKEKRYQRKLLLV